MDVENCVTAALVWSFEVYTIRVFNKYTVNYAVYYYAPLLPRPPGGARAEQKRDRRAEEDASLIVSLRFITHPHI